jgi:DNA-binding Xre family transcriptional regulator
MKEDIEYGTTGSSLDDFLKEEGIYEDVTETAIKKVIAWQLQQIMTEQHITKTELARRLKTSRAQVNRLLDPKNEGITVGMLGKAARAIGRNITLQIA